MPAINPIGFLLAAATASCRAVGAAFGPAFVPVSATAATRGTVIAPVSSTWSLAPCHGTAYKAALAVKQSQLTL